MPYVIEAARLVARELAGSGVALIGFAGAPFTVASYLIEGGPSRTFTKVKSLMHGDPALWGQLMDRLAAMSVAFLRAQIEAGAQAVQLFDSWAGSLSPDEYERFVLPTTRAVLEGIADLGVPTILFGVGTGELLGLMATAGCRRDRRRLAGAARRGPRARRARTRPCRATWTRPSAWPPGRWSRRPPAQVLAAGGADGSGTGHIFNLGPRCPARDRHRDPRCGGRPGARRERAGMTDERPVGVLVMAHGTPAAAAEIAPFYTRIRRGRPPTPEQLADLERRYAAIGGTLAAGRADRGPGGRPARGPDAAGAGPLRGGVRGQAHRRRSSRMRPAALRRGRRTTRSIGLVLTPHGSSLGSAGVLRAGRGGTRAARAAFVAVPPWYAEPGLVALLADPGHATPWPRLGVDDQARYPVIFTAHSLPERVTGPGDTYPEQLEESAAPGGGGRRPRPLAGGLAERRAHARALARPRRARRGAPAGETDGVATSTASWSAPSASWPTTSRSSTTSTSSWRPWPARSACASPARPRSTTTRASSTSWPTSSARPRRGWTEPCPCGGWWWSAGASAGWPRRGS